MEKIDFKKEIIPFILMLIPFAYIANTWSSLPDQVPIHFDIHGNANGWGGRPMIFLMPVLSIITYFLLLFLPQIDPKKMVTEFYKNNLYKIRVTVAIFLFALSMLLIHVSKAGAIDAHEVRFIPIIVILLMTVLGNFMINIKPNWFIGIRTPWTLSSDYVWKQTHLVLGRMWFYGGLLCTVLALLVSDSFLPAVVLVFSLGTTALAFAYSYLLYRREDKGNAQKI